MHVCMHTGNANRVGPYPCCIWFSRWPWLERYLEECPSRTSSRNVCVGIIYCGHVVYETYTGVLIDVAQFC